MIRMCIEVEIAEHVDTLYAREVIVEHVSLLTVIEWVKRVRVMNE